MKNQMNSFVCKVCREIFTEESGAYEGFVCENCQDKEAQEYKDFKRCSD